MLLSLLWGTGEQAYVYAAPLSVTATVPAQADDYSAALSSNETNTILGQDKTITYTITYGSILTYDTPITLKASWSRGTIDGNNDPSVDVFSYVPGSASNGYGSASPVVDTINRTITWTISSLPGNTINKTVTFQLRTSSSLTAPTKVSFSTSSQLEGPGIQTPKSTIQNYFQTTSSTSPTNTPIPTQTPTPTPIKSNPTPAHDVTPLPTQTPLRAQSKITAVEVRTILPDQISLDVNLSNPGSIMIDYGPNLSGFERRVTDSSGSRLHLVTLEDLAPSTQYFYQVKAVVNGKTLTSDIYSIITGHQGDIPTPVISTLVIASNNTILTSPMQPSSALASATPTIHLPTENVYDFHITIPDSENLRLAQAVVRRHNVLGINSFIAQADASTDGVDLIEISPHIFAGKLKTPPETGLYDIFLRLTDSGGNITEKKISELQVLKRFVVLNSRTKEPIEAASVLLSIWNSSKNRFVLLRSETTSTQNPQFTDRKGNIQVILAPGRYKAIITNLDFKQQEVLFTIGDNPGDGYPEVLLQADRFNILNSFLYFRNSIVDVYLTETGNYLNALALSRRMFHLAVLSILTSFAFLSILSLSRRTQMPIQSLFSYFNYHRKRLGKKSSIQQLMGTITDTENDTVLSAVNLYLTDISTKELVGQTTSREGKYAFGTVPSGHYLLTVLKFGYTAFSLPLHITEETEIERNIALSHHPRPATLTKRLLHLALHTIMISFESTLVLLVVIGIFVGYITGWQLVWPYLVIACFNLVLWIRHQRGY